MNIEQELQAIHERNRKVELDKAWERSMARRIAIAVVTYVVAGITLQLVHAAKPWLTALVPTMGWILSTLSLPPLKKWWIGNRK